MQTVNLYPEAAPIYALNPDSSASPDEQPRLDCYVHAAGDARPLMLICPGGGYHRRADHEGAPVAEWANELGYHAAVLHYRVQPHRAPTAQEDLRRALSLLRTGGFPAPVQTDNIVVLGFSAGGHLAGCAATLPVIDERPAAVVLCYPVITTGAYAHRGSVTALVGDDAAAAEAWSIDQRIDAHTPPIFCWHTADDGGVDVRNAYAVASACRAHDVPCELHVFPHGRHGVGLLTLECDQDPALLASVGQWPALCAQWLQTR